MLKQFFFLNYPRGHSGWSSVRRLRVDQVADQGKKVSLKYRMESLEIYIIFVFYSKQGLGGLGEFETQVIQNE